jgi:type VI secretion system secreted protein Hcp
MAYDAFLKIEFIDGEGGGRAHDGEIVLETFGWGEENQGSASLQDFHFSTRTSKASPNLMLACATGRHLGSALLRCLTHSTGFEFLRINLTDIKVTGYEIDGTIPEKPDRPMDRFSLHFTAIDFLYKVEKTGEVVESSFSLP